MSPTASNAIVGTLLRAIQHALDAEAGADSTTAARDVAQVLGLAGLERALCVCQPDDPDAGRVLERLREVCARAEAESSLQPFLDGDSELGRLAAECGGVIEGEPGPTLAGTVGAEEALADLTLADPASRAVAKRVRLAPAVSAALRAALDWLAQDGAALELRTEDSALEVILAQVDPGGVTAAGKVIAASGGNLGPVATRGRLAAVPTRGGAWRIRLPVAVARPTYLMVSQGGLELALPWHAVLRLTMVPRGRFDSGLEALGLPVLAPYVALSAGVSELPLILVAHGLKRACLVADRLVWRLPAEPCAVPSDPRVPELGAVRTEDGSIHRVVGLEELLQSVPAIASPEAEFPAAEPERPLVDPRSEPSVAPTGGVALAEREPLAPAIVSEPRHLEETLPELEPARVLPLPLKALIAEDSITARHGLARLLERDGFEIEIAATAAEMELALERGGWALVLLDVELPDARGAALLDRARKRALAAAPGAAVVALVRDAEDEAEAHAAGIARWLRKPWNPEDVARLLAELGLGPTP